MEVYRLLLERDMRGAFQYFISNEEALSIAAELTIVYSKYGIKVDKLWLAVGVIVLVQCTAPLIEYVLVENGLKRKFDQNGNMRQ